MKYFIILFTAILCLSFTACTGNKDNSVTLSVSENQSISTENGVQENNISITDTPTNTFDIEKSKEEALALWNSFLDTISLVETDSRYAFILKIVRDTAEFNSTYYEKTTGNSKDEYLAMTPYEQFLWYSTYILPVNAITSGSYETYCGSLAKWNSNAVNVPYNWLNTYGTSEMAASYRLLMEWDYNFFLETGSVYNFITEKSYVEKNQTNHP